MAYRNTAQARLDERKAHTKGFLKIRIKNIPDVEIYTRQVANGSGQMRYQVKLFKGTAGAPVFFYGFTSAAKREQYVADWLNSHVDSVAAKSRRKQAVAQATHPYKVGDILQGVYGYDETYYQYYQVVEVGAKTIKVRELNQERVEGGASGDRWLVRPVANSFAGEVELKRPQTYDGKGWYVRDRHNRLSIWDGRARYASI